jgi:hypothetical protein
VTTKYSPIWGVTIWSPEGRIWPWFARFRRPNGQGELGVDCSAGEEPLFVLTGEKHGSAETLGRGSSMFSGWGRLEI